MDNATFWSLFLVNSVRLLYCYCALPQEPICSKFDFEERILEKMVRMEHSNGVMMEEFRKLAVDVKENLRVMQSEFDMIKQEASEERERNKQMIEEYLAGLSYAFSAYWLDSHKKNVGDTLIFKHLRVNENNVYNNYTGEYTVQVNGIYIFSTTLCFCANNYVNLHILADDKVIGAFRVGDKSWYLCNSSTATAYLVKDTKVKIVVSYKN